MKRGQSALEYLVTYGWAILAIVIIAAVLWYTGVFNPSKIAGGGKGGGGFNKFTYSDHIVTTLGATVMVGNTVGRQITFTDSTVNGIACDSGLTTVVAPNALLSINCSSDISGGLPTGSAYDFAVTITYTDSQSGLAHTDTGGYVKGNVE